MKTVSLRLKDHEVAGIEAVMQMTIHKSQTGVMRRALQDLFKLLKIDSQKALKDKQAREWQRRYGRRPSQ